MLDTKGHVVECIACDFLWRVVIGGGDRVGFYCRNRAAMGPGPVEQPANRVGEFHVCEHFRPGPGVDRDA